LIDSWSVFRLNGGVPLKRSHLRAGVIEGLDEGGRGAGGGADGFRPAESERSLGGAFIRGTAALVHPGERRGWRP